MSRGVGCRPRSSSRSVLGSTPRRFRSPGGDFSFYQIPTEDFWDGLFANTPRDFAFGLKVPEHFTVKRWSQHSRYGKNAGTRNEHFLDHEYFSAAFLRPLLEHRHQVPVLMFEFGTFARSLFATVHEFLAQLGPFLEKLPQGWGYSVEIRNEDYLVPEYFSMLARHNVAHVFNAWTRMPTLTHQIAIHDAFTADFIVVRGLLRRGRAYEDAVQMFEPYRNVQQPDPQTRQALRDIATRAKRTKRRAYIFINNRLEGDAPETIDAVTSEQF